MNSRDPSSLRVLSSNSPVSGGTSSPVHRIEKWSSGKPAAGAPPPHSKSTAGSILVMSGCPSKFGFAKYSPRRPVSRSFPPAGRRTADSTGATSPSIIHPRAKRTVMSFPPRALIPWRGLIFERGTTMELPPPPVRAISALGPITAMLWTRAASRGRRPIVFFSSTVPSSATSRASARCCAELMIEESGAGWGFKSPVHMITRSIRVILSSMTGSFTSPRRTASRRLSPRRNCPLGISISRPAFTVGTMLCTAPQSETTIPLNPHSRFSTSVRRNGFSLHQVPFTLLYADMMDQLPPSCTAA